MKEIKIIEHAYCRFPMGTIKKPVETINKTDAPKTEPIKLTPIEKYIRKYTPEGEILAVIEKEPGALAGSSFFDKEKTEALKNLRDSATVEEENGLVHKINYNKLPILFEKTEKYSIFKSINSYPEGLTRKDISQWSEWIRDTDIDKLVDSGLLEKGRKKHRGTWRDIIYSFEYAEKIKGEQKVKEEKDLARISDIIEKQLNKQKDKKETNLDSASAKIIEIIDSKPTINPNRIKKNYDVGLPYPSYINDRISQLIESGSIITLDSEELGIMSPISSYRRRGGRQPTKYLFSRGYFEEFLKEGKSLKSPELITKIMSDIKIRY